MQPQQTEPPVPHGEHLASFVTKLIHPSSSSFHNSCLLAPAKEELHENVAITATLKFLPGGAHRLGVFTPQSSQSIQLSST
jgi:hypothetical protein